MDDYEPRFDRPDTHTVCDICGTVIPLGMEYVTICAEDESGAVIGHLVAHPECADALNEREIAALLGAVVGDDADDLDEILPLERCCLCGDFIGEDDYLNLIEPMLPGDPTSPLVATSFHIACYRDDPDGVQRALDEEILKQRLRRTDDREI